MVNARPYRRLDALGTAGLGGALAGGVLSAGGVVAGDLGAGLSAAAAASGAGRKPRGRACDLRSLDSAGQALAWRCSHSWRRTCKPVPCCCCIQRQFLPARLAELCGNGVMIRQALGSAPLVLCNPACGGFLRLGYQRGISLEGPGIASGVVSGGWLCLLYFLRLVPGHCSLAPAGRWAW